MIYYKYDSQTLIYTETVETNLKPENSTDKKIPEITEYYTPAFINNEWICVVNPKYEIVNNEFVRKQDENENLILPLVTEEITTPSSEG